MRMRKALLAVALLMLALPCRPQVPASEKRIHVLFVGNSFTYVNDLPRIVSAMSRADGGGGPRVDCRMVAFPGFSLEDHWKRGDARRAIEEQPWDFVILQQGPSASEDGLEVLVEYASRFAPLIRKAGARVAFYMPWPSGDRKQDFPGVSASYRQAARVTQGLVLPAGEAWEKALRRDAKLELYGPDNLHPTNEGSYLAALVVYAGLTGRSVANMPATLPLGAEGKIEIPEKDAPILREAAAEVR
ncbi:MAG TPA: hypothetical protein VH854_05775 [Thermoanaerobaculia bacterium]|nr:hypothetical protein [Thermoanaerobaculia bacterium]